MGIEFRRCRVRSGESIECSVPDRRFWLGMILRHEAWKEWFGFDECLWFEPVGYGTHL